MSDRPGIKDWLPTKQKDTTRRANSRVSSGARRGAQAQKRGTRTALLLRSGFHQSLSSTTLQLQNITSRARGGATAGQMRKDAGLTLACPLASFPPAPVCAVLVRFNTQPADVLGSIEPREKHTALHFLLAVPSLLMSACAGPNEHNIMYCVMP